MRLVWPRGLLGLGGFFDLYLLGLGLRGLRDLDVQHALGHRRLYGRRVDFRRQLEGAVKDAIASFRHVDVLVLLLAFDFLFGADRQDIAVQRNVDVLALETRQFDRDLEFLVGLRNLHSGREQHAASILRHAEGTRKVEEQPFEFSPQGVKRV